MKKEVRGKLVTGEDGETVFVPDENQGSPQETKATGDVPVSLLDHYAATAPEIPDWFQHEEPEKDYPEPPSLADHRLSEQDRDHLRTWINHSEVGMPDHLKWYPEETKKANHLRAMWHQINEEARFFQWRLYYAQEMVRMVEALKKEGA